MAFEQWTSFGHVNVEDEELSFRRIRKFQALFSTSPVPASRHYSAGPAPASCGVASNCYLDEDVAGSRGE